jgi:hypothetical protein
MRRELASMANAHELSEQDRLRPMPATQPHKLLYGLAKKAVDFFQRYPSDPFFAYIN